MSIGLEVRWRFGAGIVSRAGVGSERRGNIWYSPARAVVFFCLPAVKELSYQVAAVRIPTACSRYKDGWSSLHWRIALHPIHALLIGLPKNLKTGCA